MGRKRARRSTIGNVWQLRGKWAAKYEHNYSTHNPGVMFRTHAMADAWLAEEERLIERGEWTPPADRRAADKAEQEATKATAEPLDTYARAWITARTVRGKGTPLAARTVDEYHRYLSGILAPLAALPLDGITRDDVDQWWAANVGTPALRHHAYSFLKSVLSNAVDRERIPANPCRVENAASLTPATPRAERAALVTELDPSHVFAMADAMPGRHRFLVLLLAWCGLRPGEAFALRKTDLHRATHDGVERIRINTFRAVTKGPDGGAALVESVPKTPGSVRVVLLPPHLVPDLDTHLAEHAAPGPDGLLFPSSNPALPYATVQQVTGSSAKVRKDRKGGKHREASGWNAARLAVGRPSLRLYDLRHWARRQWTRAGLDTASTELLLGHALPGVMGNYAHLDLDHCWPYLVRCSELAGWRAPTPAKRAAVAIPPRLLAAMTPDQLAGTLADMTESQLAEAVPLLPPDKLAAVFAAMGDTKDAGVSGSKGAEA